jgi:ABC-type phosphate/phosphonate transport system substrate-binding protein
MGHSRFGLAAILILTGLAGAGAALPAQEPAAPAVRIGLVQSLFRDVPAPMVQMLTAPFTLLMRAQTGLDGQLVTVPDALDLGRQMEKDEVQLGVFHGVEFAWAQHKYPDLRPLCIAINRHRNLYALLVTCQDSAATTMADFKGKVVALPQRSREHCRLFLEHQCAACGADSAHLFAQVVTPANVESALDDVLRGKAQAAVVDGVSLECYGQAKPGCRARLKVLQQSELFPAAVVAYRQGALDQATLDRFRNGMITANQSERGRELMTLWKLTAFEPIPADFAQSLANILKAYPAPDGGAARAGQPTGAAAP